MKMHIDIVWNEDNSATIAMTVGITKSAMSLMEATESDIQAQLREGMEFNENYSFENFSDKEYAGVIATLKVDDITKKSADSVDQLNFRSSGEGKKRTYTVSGQFSGGGLTEGKSDLVGIEIDTQISIQMPGKIVSHNATEKKGNTLIWALNDSPTVSIDATSEAGGGGMLWLWIVIIVLVLAGGAVVFLFIMRKKKGSSHAGPPYTPDVPPVYANPAQNYNTYQEPPVQTQPASPPSWEPPAPVAPSYQPPPPPPAWEPPAPVAPPYQPPQPPAPPPPAWEPPAPAAPPYQPPQPPAPPPPAWEPQAPAAPQYQPPYQTQYQAPYQPPQPPSGARTCPQCGATLAGNSKFCNICGAATP